MKFTEYLFENTKHIWEKYLSHPFITEIGESTLPKEKFRHYLIQDYLYLKEYSKVFCMGVVKSKTMEEMKFFYNSTKGTMEDETAVHIEYMNRLGVSPESAEKYDYDLITSSYTSYMQAISLTGNLKEIAIATLPCTWSYSYIGHYLKENYKENSDSNYYKAWIDMYSDKMFDDFTNNWIEYVDKICNDLEEKEKEKLLEIFIKCSVYELEFWDMAYEEIKEGAVI